jgi:uncharacterized membrane protein
VLETIERHRHNGSLSIATTQVESVNDPEHDRALVKDIDDAPWDDVQAQLRQHAQISPNFVALMLLGGVVAACALVSSGSQQAIALVAAAIIAPAFEPVAKVPLGAVLGRLDVLGRGVRSTLVGYGLIALAGAVTMLVLDAAGADMSARFLENRQVGELADPRTTNLLISAAGAVAGVIIITAFRLPLLPGPIVALHLVPATALVGMALALGEGGLAAEGLARLAIDVLFIVLAGLVVFALKDRFVHRRGRT